MSKFGDKIRKAREEKKLSQRDLATISTISNAEISRIESGKRKNPGVQTIFKLSQALEIPFDELTHLALSETE